MTDGGADRLEKVLDDDDDRPPPPMTFAERKRIAVVGGLAIVAATTLLIWALGGDRNRISARDELTASRPHHRE